jgi:hypothetical protein
MADVCLALRDAATPGRLPALCMQCGKEARTVRRMKMSMTGFSAPPPGCGEIGCLFALLELIGWMTAKYVPLHAPLCRYHRWIVPPSFQVRSITADSIELTGVSEAFAQALNR